MDIKLVGGFETFGKDLDQWFAIFESGTIEYGRAVSGEDIAENMQRIDLECVVTFIEAVKEESKILLRKCLSQLLVPNVRVALSDSINIYLIKKTA